MSARRVVAAVLPDLLCELVSPTESPKLLGVVEAQEKEDRFGDVLVAVNEAARRCGMRVGMRVAEATAIASHLVVKGVPRSVVHDALGSVAEVLSQFAPLVAIELAGLPVLLDAVFIDITGSVHLWSDESALLEEMAMRVLALGHRVRVAVSDGPWLARAFALSASHTQTIAPPSGAAPLMVSWPLDRLPLSDDIVTFFARLGVFSIGDLEKLAPSAARSRLGPWADRVLALIHGQDDLPLNPYRAAQAPQEKVGWDEPVETVEPLLFALRRLTSRLAARLEGRAQAARSLELCAPYDASIAKLRGIEEKALVFGIELPHALSSEQDLFRVIKSKLERSTLLAPTTGMSIMATHLCQAPVVQLSLGGDITLSSDPRAWSLLLAELSTQVGRENVGVLGVERVHTPEGKSALFDADAHALSAGQGSSDPTLPSEGEVLPSRLLAKPVLVDVALVRGATLAIGRQLFTVRRVSHPVRFDDLRWWTDRPVCRDYVRVLLSLGSRSIEAWMFTDRTTGQTYLHGYYD